MRLSPSMQLQRILSVQNMSNELPGEPRCIYLHTFYLRTFAHLSESQGHENLVKDMSAWLQKRFSGQDLAVVLDNHDIIFIPHHINHNHWALVAVHLKKKALVYLDSLRQVRFVACINKLVCILCASYLPQSPTHCVLIKL